MTEVITLQPDAAGLAAPLPQALVDRLHLTAGDRLFAVGTEQGILLTPHEPELQEVLRLGEQISAQYRNALAALAK